MGKEKELKSIWYKTFKVSKWIGDYAYQLNLLPYIEIYSIVNIENLKSFEPSMLDNEPSKVLPFVKDLMTD